MKRFAFVLLVLVSLPCRVWATETRDVVGVAHAGGKYNFSTTGQDYLNEGADRVRAIGTRVIKVFVTGHPRVDYAFNNSEFPAAPTTLVEVAQSAPFVRLFNKDFTTFVIVVATPNDTRFSDGITDTEYTYEQSQIYDLAKYLITTYANTGKTFILQNWEGDWKLEGNFTSTGFDGMKRYLAARQAGVTQARNELYYVTGVTVKHAAEVNLVADAMDFGLPRAVNNVLPFVSADLYSYSSWDLDVTSAQNLTRALDYIATTVGISHDRLYLGEFGQPENDVGEITQRDHVRNLTYAALAWGVKYAIYWQIFCDNYRPGQVPPPTNAKMAGFWLVRVDNTQTALYSYMNLMWGTRFYRVGLRNLNRNQYMVAENGGGDVVNANRLSVGAWETFTLIDVDGWDILTGNDVHLLARNGMFVVAENGGGGRMLANNLSTGSGTDPYAFFTIQKIGTGPIVSGDQIALTAYLGQDVNALDDGSASATGTRPGGAIPAASTWYFELQP